MMVLSISVELHQLPSSKSLNNIRILNKKIQNKISLAVERTFRSDDLDDFDSLLYF